MKRPPEPPGAARAALGEFEIIARHLSALGARRDDVVLGVGDDAALVSAPPDARLGAATASIRPRAGEPAAALAERLLSHALVRLRAAGAEPAWATLALTLHAEDTTHLAAFAAALDAAAARAGVAVVGGDTTRGPTRLTMTVLGPLVDPGPGAAARPLGKPVGGQ